MEFNKKIYKNDLYFPNFTKKKQKIILLQPISVKAFIFWNIICLFTFQTTECSIVC